MFKVWEFLKYLHLAKDEHSIHSPFVYDFFSNVIKSEADEKHFIEIENRRNALLHCRKKIKVTDLGTGTSNHPLVEKRLSFIASSSLLPKRYAQLQYRMIFFLKPKNIIELGTSLGITSLYLVYGYPEGFVYTFEGCPEIAKTSENMFKELGLKNIRVIVGDFKTTFEEKIKDLTSVDYIFIDGNHKYLPTIDYFTTALKYSRDETVFVFDDINWSQEMMQAWKEIKFHKQVTLTIDLYRLGIAFISKKLSKENFILKY